MPESNDTGALQMGDDDSIFEQLFDIKRKTPPQIRQAFTSNEIKGINIDRFNQHQLQKSIPISIKTVKKFLVDRRSV